MSTRKTLPIALTIAGSDSGGGAGIQADLKTFFSLGVHGASVVTCLTAQNPSRVKSVHPSKPSFVRDQLEAVFEELPPAAIKSGMLYSAATIRTIAHFLGSHNEIPLVVDPVMIATSGARLIKSSASRALRAELFPLASLITPNLDEASAILGAPISSIEDMRACAREFHQRFGCPTLMKGGHLKGEREAADIYYDGKEEILLTAPFIKGLHTHGTGCTYSAAITALLASGLSLPEAVARAKEYISNAIANSQLAAGHAVLNWTIPRSRSGRAL